MMKMVKSVALVYLILFLETTHGQNMAACQSNPLNGLAATLNQAYEVTLYPMQGIRQRRTCSLPDGTTGTYDKTGVWAGTSYPRCDLQAKAFLFVNSTGRPMEFDLQKAVPTLSSSDLKLVANKKPLVVYFFGYDPSTSESTIPTIKDATVKMGANVLLLSSDFAASNLDYNAALGDMRFIGDLFVLFFKSLIAQKAVAGSTTVIVGHSAGAHLAGIVGPQISDLRAIIGLDPAGPFFDCNTDLGLTIKSAAFVQVLYSNYNETLRYGTALSRGHVNIFLNRGVSAVQPGCSESVQPSLTGELAPRQFACSHFRAFDIFFQAVTSATGKCTFRARPLSPVQSKTTPAPVGVFDGSSLKNFLGSKFTAPKTLGDFNLPTSSNAANLCADTAPARKRSMGERK